MGNSLKARMCYALKCTIQPMINTFNRMRLKNDNFTIISSTCAGGIIYHRLGKQFSSPTVNLWLTDKDLMKVAARLHHYMACELEFVDEPTPDGTKAFVARLEDVRIFFNHADSIDEARELWNRRRERINYDNVFVVACDRWLDENDIREFGKLPVKGKVIFTAKEYPQYDYCLCLKEYEKRGEKTVGEYMLNHTPILDQFVFEKYFDYTRWLNTGRVK